MVQPQEIRPQQPPKPTRKAHGIMFSFKPGAAFYAFNDCLRVTLKRGKLKPLVACQRREMSV